MAALNFPSNPTDGQLYPDPAQPGVQQYQYNEAKGTWLTVFRGIEAVSGTLPIFISGPPSRPDVNIRPATPVAAGSMSAADKAKIDLIPTIPGTVTSVTAGVGLGAPLSGDSITSTGTINLLPATSTVLGGVKAGVNTQIDPEGFITVKPPTPLIIGGVKAGNNITIAADGTISATGGGGGGGYAVLDSLAGQFNGSQATFQLNVLGVPVNAPTNSLLIYLGGIIQVPGEAFNVTGATITFTGSPAAGTSFYGVVLGGVTGSTVTLSGFTVLDPISGQFDGSRTQFQMTAQGTAINPPTQSLMIFVGGVNQVPGLAFTSTSSTLNFTSAPPAGASFYGVSLQ
jgi:hypothetical protein